MELLSKYVEFKNGKKRPNAKGTIPVYGGNGILDYTNDSNMENGVVIGRVGVYCGSVFLVKDECWVSDNAIKAICKQGMDLGYLYYLLLSLRLNEMRIGTSQPLLTQTILNSIEVDVPNLKTQKKIAGILDSLDEKIRTNNKINNNLFEQAQALFVSWFVDYEPFGGKMPNDWENISVYDLADYINGAAFKKSEYAENGLPIVKIAELKNGITDSTQYCNVMKDEKYYINDRDILFSWSGNPDTSIDTFIWSMGQAVLNQHTFRVVSKYDAPAFTFFLLKYLKPQFTHIASNKQTTGLGHVTVADLKRLQFSANASVIAEFNALVMPMFDLIYLKYKEIQKLSDVRDTLLPKLMSGEVDVSGIDI